MIWAKGIWKLSFKVHIYCWIVIVDDTNICLGGVLWALWMSFALSWAFPILTYILTGLQCCHALCVVKCICILVSMFVVLLMNCSLSKTAHGYLLNIINWVILTLLLSISVPIDPCVCMVYLVNILIRNILTTLWRIWPYKHTLRLGLTLQLLNLLIETFLRQYCFLFTQFLLMFVALQIHRLLNCLNWIEIRHVIIITRLIAIGNHFKRPHCIQIGKLLFIHLNFI